MSFTPKIKTLTTDIKTLFEHDHSQAEVSIERYLQARLKSYSDDKKLETLEELKEKFKTSKPVEVSLPLKEPDVSQKEAADVSEKERADVSQKDTYEKEMLHNVFSTLLHKEIMEEELSSTELLERAFSSLNTVFDILNQIVHDLNKNFFNKEFDPDKTIKGIIVDHIVDKNKSGSIEDYLTQIKDAFKIIHEAFQVAVRNKVGEILTELDPERIEKKAEESWKFGHLKKAMLFEIYKQSYEDCSNWFKDGRFMDDFLWEFEKACQNLYHQKER